MHPKGFAAWLLAWLLVTGPAAAQQVDGPTCNHHGDLVEILKSTYAEEPDALGLQGNGHLLEVFVSRKTGSWTIVSTQPDGTSCIIAAGRSWQAVPRADEPVV
jgi:hypothetical protein